MTQAIKPALLFLLCLCTSLLAEKRVESGEFIKNIILTGSLRAQKAEHFVVPRTNTFRIQLKWMVREGAEVKPGEPVARFDTSSLLSEIENIEMSLRDKQEQKIQKRAENRHQKLELKLKLKQAEIEYKKRELDASVPESLISRYEYDRSQLELKKSAEASKRARIEKRVKLTTLKSETQKLEIEIQEERSKLERYQNMLEDLTLVAKTAGAVIYAEHEFQGRKIQVGDTVFATMTVATIPDNQSLRVEAWVNEAHIRQMKPGLPVDVTLDAYPDQRFSGKIKEVLNNAEKRKQWGRAHYFMVIIELEARDLTIMKPGMSVRCVAHLARVLRVRLIPLEMAYFDGRFFWIKPAGKEPQKVEPLGVNEFHLALVDDGTIEKGVLLQPVKPSEIGVNNHEKH